MGGVVKSVFGGGGDDSADAARDAASIQAQYQRDALKYLKQTERIPQQYRERAIKELGGAFGVGDPEAQQRIIDQAQSSPLYSAIMGTQEAGEEAIMRQAAATGGLRSGNVQDALASNAQQLQSKALLESYNQQIQGLGGLAGMPSLAPQIASSTAGIGQTIAQGQVAAAQAQQAGNQQTIDNVFGLAGLAASFSDRRLKKNIIRKEDKSGVPWFSWEWNDEAKELGLEGQGEGTIADVLEKTHPQFVGSRSGYKTVDYEGLLCHLNQ